MNSQRLLERFLRYIACDSESKNERKFCEFIEEELKALGLPVARDDAGNYFGSNGWNIYTSLPGEGEPILLCAHMDTVSPGINIKAVVEGGIVRAAGDTILGADNKSGIAIIMETLQTLLEQSTPHRPIEVLFTLCEEEGLLGAQYADYSKLKSKQAVVLDLSKPDCLLIHTTALANIHVAVTGRSSHATRPENGISALKAASVAVANIPCGHVDKDTAVNVANFLAPGKFNIVSDHASFIVNIRCYEDSELDTHINKTEDIVRQACESLGATYTFNVERFFDALKIQPDSLLVAELKEAFRKAGKETQTGRYLGNSDATWLFRHGIEAVNVDCGQRNPHSLNEQLSIKDFEQAYLMVMSMTEPNIGKRQAV